MRKALLALVLLSGTAAVAGAQPFVPGPPPGFRPPPPPAYWQERHDELEWRRRAEFREAEHRRWEWRRTHCVRDWEGREFCR